MSRKPRATRKKANNAKAVENIADIHTHFENPSEDEYKMHFTKCRLASFQNWPFDAESNCNPTSLANAGFYHIPSKEAPDAVRCFVCFKELDGWESEDCPRDEHKKHAAQCPFLKMKKSIFELTLDEFLKLECERQKHKVRKHYHAKIQILEDQVNHVKTELKKLSK